jgi:hypothetical protein
MESGGQYAEQKSCMIQVDGLMTRLSFVDHLDLLLDMVRNHGMKVEIQVIAVVAK